MTPSCHSSPNPHLSFSSLFNTCHSRGLPTISILPFNHPNPTLMLSPPSDSHPNYIYSRISRPSRMGSKKDHCSINTKTVRCNNGLALYIPTVTYFHLLTHASFKALLFICAGALIHFSAYTQDLRKVGNLSSRVPLTISALTAANLALTGIPFFSGFYSKDIILELSLFNPLNALLLSLFLLAALLTASYSIRLMIIIL